MPAAIGVASEQVLSSWQHCADIQSAPSVVALMVPHIRQGQFLPALALIVTEVYQGQFLINCFQGQFHVMCVGLDALFPTVYGLACSDSYGEPLPTLLYLGTVGATKILIYYEKVSFSIPQTRLWGSLKWYRRNLQKRILHELPKLKLIISIHTDSGSYIAGDALLIR